MMNAVQFNKYGGPEVLDFTGNIADPIPLKNQMVVEVYAASVNPVDVKLRSGSLKEILPLEFPVTIGGDFAGIIVKSVEGNQLLREGDRVFGQASVLNGGTGTFAEYAAVNAGNCAMMPVSMGFEEAASFPLAGASALQAIEDHIRLRKGQRIVIHGGAGGIGSIAVQLAKSIGAFVATTVRTGDREFARELGAEVVVDYQTQSFENMLREYDAVLDTVGGDITTKSFRIVRAGGIVVSMTGQPDKEAAGRSGVIAVGQMTLTTTERLERLAAHLDQGHIKPRIDRIFPFSEARKAFVHAEREHPRGKVVVKVR